MYGLSFQGGDISNGLARTTKNKLCKTLILQKPWQQSWNHSHMLKDRKKNLYIGIDFKKSAYTFVPHI